jgi:3-oxoadipate enol-lactonase
VASFIEKGEGPAVLCLHGIGGGASNFNPQIEDLSKNYQVISWNMPGYGDAAPLEKTSFQGLSNAAFDILDTLGIEQTHLIGHSMGGMLAIEMAVRQPSRIASLSLIGATSAFGGPNEEFKDNFVKSRLEPLKTGHSVADITAKSMAAMLGSKGGTEYSADIIAAAKHVSVDAYRSSIECLTHFDRRAEFQELPHPMCLIAGSEDRAAPAKTMEKLAARAQDAKFHCLDHIGHFVQLAAPTQTNAILLNFLKRVSNR